MRKLVFILEEPSMRSFLLGSRPRLPIPSDWEMVFRISNGFGDLKTLVNTTLRRGWPPGTRFVILFDKDKADCRARKHDIALAIPDFRRSEVLVRVVCYELESWYFGDPDTLAERYPRFAQVRNRSRFRSSPDAIQKPSTDIREYSGLGKGGLAEELGPTLKLEGNRSPSLQVFLSGLQRLLSSSSTDATRSN